jgi:hypothetical protein
MLSHAAKHAQPPRDEAQRRVPQSVDGVLRVRRPLRMARSAFAVETADALVALQ